MTDWYDIYRDEMWILAPEIFSFSLQDAEVTQMFLFRLVGTPLKLLLNGYESEWLKKNSAKFTQIDIP